MDKIYYNKFEFKKALDCIYNNPFEAKKRFEEYFCNYPKDISAYSYYVTLLITLKELDSAEKILKRLNVFLNKKSYYINNKDKIDVIKQNIVFAYLKLYIYKNEYQKAYEFCKENYNIFGINIKLITLYLKSKLDLVNKHNRDNNSYIKRQIIEYSEEEFLEHIERHEADYNIDLDEPNNNLFVPEFDIFKIIKEVKKYIPSSNKMYSGFFEDVYIFRYDECGRINNKLCNYFKVITFHDTCDFITMYSVKEGENYNYVDLNYLKDYEEIKVKKISQVDKFYKRYKFK